MRIWSSSILFSGTLLAIVLEASAFSIFGNWTGLVGSIFNADHTTDCVCENGNCVTDYRGKTKCICKPRYVIQTEGVCKECYCGEKGKCYFQYLKNTYHKKCLCDAGFADKDGTCTDCQCGENSKCEFEGDDRICYCMDGFSELEGVCTVCECGEFGECHFENGQKQCTCYEGYLVHDGKCKECDCGNGGCSFDGAGNKVCKCDEGYSLKGDRCEACDCGENSEGCSFDSAGKKVCACPSGFAQRIGECAACQCGTHSTNCQFDNVGTKVCTCENGFAQNDENCEACSCGEKTIACVFNQGRKDCTCADGYTPINDVCRAKCQDDGECKNGGSCVGEQGKKICNCRKGTRGDNCEIIDGCKELDPNCHNSGGTCKYDVERESAFCDCPGGKPWNPVLFKCEICQCGTHSTNCLFDSSGVKVCTCENGYAQNGESCEACSCGEKTTGCSFDQGRKVCACADGYTPVNGVCTAKCQEDKDCKNGGSCGGEQDKKVCKCKKGTSGDNCEIIDGCKELDPNCHNSGGTCKYDVESESAFCDCPGGKPWNPVLFRCESCDCGTNSVSCAFDSQGQRICQCQSGFAQRGDTCASCSCGEKTRSCSFNGDTKVCTCADGYTPINGVCKAECRDDKDCKNGGSCVEEQGKKVCRCKKGTSGDNCEIIDGCNEIDQYCRESGGVCKYDVVNNIATCECQKGLSWNPGLLKCQKCDCGVYAKGCHYNLRGQMICTCPAGYAQWGELCQVCSCGEKTKSCHFTATGKVCTCADGYTLIKGECRSDAIGGCRDDRDCKNGGSCVKEGNIKVCRCKKRTRGDYCEIIDDCSPNCPKTGGVCKYDAVHQNIFCDCMPRGMLWNPAMDRCQECNCGANFKACGFDLRGQKVCTCTWGYAQWGDNCVPCSCGDATKTCAFQNGQRVCTCANGFVAINGVCVAACQDDRQCIPGAKCVGEVGHKMCKCRNGLTGRNCEIIIDCERLGPYCHNSGGLCRYDLAREVAYCQCPNGLFWNSALARCESCWCGPNSKACGFGPQGQKVCYCPWGFAQKGGACVWCNCGPNSVSCSFCSYGRVVCGCRQGFFQRGAYCVGRRGYANELSDS